MLIGHPDASEPYSARVNSNLKNGIFISRKCLTIIVLMIIGWSALTIDNLVNKSSAITSAPNTVTHSAVITTFKIKALSYKPAYPLSVDQCYPSVGPGLIIVRPGDKIQWEVAHNDNCKVISFTFMFPDGSPFTASPTLTQNLSTNHPTSEIYSGIISPNAKIGKLYKYTLTIPTFNQGGYYQGTKSLDEIVNLQAQYGFTLNAKQYTPYSSDYPLVILVSP